MLAYSSLVRCFSAVLLAVPTMGVSLGCGNMSMDVDDVMIAVLWAAQQFGGTDVDSAEIGVCRDKNTFADGIFQKKKLQLLVSSIDAKLAIKVN